MQCANLQQSAEKIRPAVGPKILVIDDDPSLLALVRTFLARAGYGVLEASNGLEGLRLLRRTAVDLLITDMIMPEYEGVETILRVRALHPAMKILAMSGVNARHSYLRLATRVGANATLEKSLIPKQLIRSVQSLLSMS